MKKIVCLLLCLMMAAICCACGEDKDGSASSEAQAQVPTEEEILHPVSASGFDDAVCVGDRITLKLNYYCEDDPAALGDAEFFCSGSLGFQNALWDLDDPNAVHPYYRGEMVLTENCAAATDSSKVFILLGMNDIGLYGVKGTQEGCEKLVAKIKAKSPDVKIYLQSVTPMLSAFEYEDYTNVNIDVFNAWLKEYCEKNGYRYLDINSIMRDENGALKEEYCSDPEAMGIHFTDAACALWVDYLKNHV